MGRTAMEQRGSRGKREEVRRRQSSRVVGLVHTIPPTPTPVELIQPRIKARLYLSHHDSVRVENESGTQAEEAPQRQRQRQQRKQGWETHPTPINYSYCAACLRPQRPEGGGACCGCYELLHPPMVIILWFETSQSLQLCTLEATVL